MKVPPPVWSNVHSPAPPSGPPVRRAAAMHDSQRKRAGAAAGGAAELTGVREGRHPAADEGREREPQRDSILAGPAGELGAFERQPLHHHAAQRPGSLLMLVTPDHQPYLPVACMLPRGARPVVTCSEVQASGLVAQVHAAARHNVHRAGDRAVRFVNPHGGVLGGN